MRVKEGSAKTRLTNYQIKKGVPGSELRTVKTREDIVSLCRIIDDAVEDKNGDGADWS